MAEVVGIEPTSKVLETFVLPLNYTPMVDLLGIEPRPIGYEPTALPSSYKSIIIIAIIQPGGYSCRIGETTLIPLSRVLSNFKIVKFYL